MPDDVVVEDTQGLAQFKLLLPEANALDSRDVKAFRIDPVIALQNVHDGVAAILAIDEARIRAELPTLDLDMVRALPDLAQAVSYSARRAELMVSPSALALLKEANEWRNTLLAVAEALAAAGLLSPAKIKKIRKGTGGIDRAKDCVDLAAILTENAAAIRGKNPLTAAQIKRAGEVGAELLNTLKPKGSPRQRRSKEAREASKERDRLGTLLVQRYDLVRRAGAWFFGEQADDHVPPLGSVRRRRSKPKT
jgi:hypothetical protein